MKLKIGITIGDINGIGPEVLIKSVSDPRITDICTPVIYGSAKVISYHKNIAKVENFFYNIANTKDKIVEGKINLINCWNENVTINIGTATKDGGKFAKLSLDTALTDLNDGVIDALVTSPVNKQALDMINFGFKGHTDYLAHFTSQDLTIMMMVNDDLKVALMTHHIPLMDVEKYITKDSVMGNLKLLNEILIRDFDKERPIIAVLGLNPHAGDGGLMGKQEIDILSPAIAESKSNGIFVYGPFAPDSFWGTLEFKKFDAVLCMYHDQALIPFKLMSFEKGVNFTGGLPFVRTSPDHGTAYDIVGKNVANHESFLNAIFTAVNITKNRMEYDSNRKDALIKRAKPSEEIDE